MNCTADELAEYFGYLDTLRKTGVTNMYGAVPYLRDAFGLDRANGTAVLKAWMNLPLDETPHARAATALAVTTETRP